MERAEARDEVANGAEHETELAPSGVWTFEEHAIAIPAVDEITSCGFGVSNGVGEA
jgi:hypothetical protein